jgi:GMP synthase (glutamine-hydrolysing)
MIQPLLIIETGRPIEALRRHRGFGHWIRVAAGLPSHAVRCRQVDDGTALPEPADCSGVLVSGSAAMVTDREAWSERCADWLRRAHAQQIPLLGICYGHQLLAHALGGRVDFHPQGREIGTVRLHCQLQAQDDPLFRGLPAQFLAQMSHLQSVLEAPPGSRALACSAHEAHAALHFGAHSWGLQFHPEFSVLHMRSYIQARADALRREGADPRALRAAVSATPWARRLLRRFVGLCRERGHSR